MVSPPVLYLLSPSIRVLYGFVSNLRYRGTQTGGNMDASVLVIAGLSLQSVLCNVPSLARSGGCRGEDFFFH